MRKLYFYMLTPFNHSFENCTLMLAEHFPLDSLYFSKILYFYSIGPHWLAVDAGNRNMPPAPTVAY